MAKIKNQNLIIVGGKEPVLQEKSVEITENTTTTITADEGFDGLSKVDITTDVAGSGGGDGEEWEYPADIAWARAICENDVQEGFTSKVLQLIGDDFPTLSISIPTNGAVKTSDGSYYTTNATHTWDDTQARTPESCKEYKKLRWIIHYYPANGVSNTALKKFSNAIYRCYYNMTVWGLTENYNHQLEYLDIIGNGSIEASQSNMLGYNAVLKSIEFSNIKGGGLRQLLRDDVVLERLKLGVSNITNLNDLYTSTSLRLKYVEFVDTSNITNMTEAFRNTLITKVPEGLNTSQVTTMASMFFACSALKTVSKEELNTSNVISMASMFGSCANLKSVSINTPQVTNMNSMFSSSRMIESIELSDMINVTSVSSMFYYCNNLKTLNLKNIKVTLTIGSAGSTSSVGYGNLLTKESLINTIKELWDYSTDTSGTTHKLTMGSINTSKIYNTYVKLITPTAEQIAQDPNLIYKMPCELCESTDEGAMLIRDYATLKGWTTA